MHFNKGYPNNVRDAMKNVLEVPYESLNDRYMGLPTELGRNKNSTFKYLKNMVWNKIQGWIEHILSAGGRCAR